MSDISKELSQKETSLLTRTAQGVDILVQRTDDERWYRDVELRAVVEVLRRIRWAVIERIVTAELVSDGQVVLTTGPSKTYQIGITGPWLKEPFEFADSTWRVVEGGEEIERDPPEDETIPANEVPSPPSSPSAEEPWRII